MSGGIGPYIALYMCRRQRAVCGLEHVGRLWREAVETCEGEEAVEGGCEESLPTIRSRTISRSER